MVESALFSDLTTAQAQFQGLAKVSCEFTPYLYIQKMHDDYR